VLAGFMQGPKRFALVHGFDCSIAFICSVWSHRSLLERCAGLQFCGAGFLNDYFDDFFGRV